MSRLKELRTAKNWSLAELARRSGISHVTISLIETGNIRKSRISTVSKLAFALGVDPGELLSEEKE